MRFPFSFWKTTAVAFDPTTLALDGYWRPNYVASPWTGIATAGLSNGRTLSEATNPPSVDPSGQINGRDPADFDGTDDRLRDQTRVLSDYQTASAFSVGCLFYADAAFADGGAGTRYLNPGLFADGGAVFSFAFSSAGVTLTNDGGVTELAVACATGGWHLAQAKLSGGTMSLRVDSGARSTIAAANTADLTGNLRIGVKFSGAGTFFNGRIAELYSAKVALSDAEEDNFKAYVNSTYVLAL